MKIELPHPMYPSVKKWLIAITLIFSFQLQSLAGSPSQLDVPIYADGKITNIGNLAQGQPSLLIFWAVDCQFCKKEVPSINALQQKFGDKVLILAVNNDQSFEALKRIPNYIEEHRLQAKVVKDPKSYLSAYFNVPGTPTAIVLDKEGRIRQKTHAKLHKLEETLQKLVSKAEINSG